MYVACSSRVRNSKIMCFMFSVYVSMEGAGARRCIGGNCSLSNDRHQCQEARV